MEIPPKEIQSSHEIDPKAYKPKSKQGDQAILQEINDQVKLKRTQSHFTIHVNQTDPKFQPKIDIPDY